MAKETHRNCQAWPNAPSRCQNCPTTPATLSRPDARALACVELSCPRPSPSTLVWGEQRPHKMIHIPTPANDVEARPPATEKTRTPASRTLLTVLVVCAALAGCTGKRFEIMTDAGNPPGAPAATDDDGDTSDDSPGALTDDTAVTTIDEDARSQDAGPPSPPGPEPSATPDPQPSSPDATTPTPHPSPDGAATPPSPEAGGPAPVPSQRADAGTEPQPTTPAPESEAGPPPIEPPPAIGQLVADYESGTITLGAFTTGASANDPTIAPGELPEELEGIVLLGAGDYTIGTDLVVPEGVVLILAEGAHVVLADGVTLSVMGQLYGLGTASNPFTIEGGGSAGFAEILLAGGRSELHQCDVRNGTTLLHVEETGLAPVEIDHCTIDGWQETGNGVLLGLAEDVWIHDSTLGTDAQGAAASSAVVAKESMFVLQNNTIGAMAPAIDALDLDDCTPDATAKVVGNVLVQGGQDAIAVSNCRMIVANNRIEGFDSDPDLASCFEAKTNAQILMAGNLMANCANGMVLYNDAFVLLLNNSIVSATRGIHATDTAQIKIVGNVFWDNTLDLSVETDASSKVEHNIIDASGSDNVVSDPLFETRDGFDYHLATGSPARQRDYAYAEDVADGTPFEPSEIAEVLQRDLAGASRTLPIIDFGALSEQ